MKSLTYAVRVQTAKGVLSVETPAANRDMAKRSVMASCRVTASSVLSVKVAQRYPTKTQLVDLLKPNAVQVFYTDAASARDARNAARENGERPDECDAPTRVGWYYWTCLPGCLPDSTAFGPFASPLAAMRNAYDNDFLPEPEPESDYGPVSEYRIVVGNIGTVLDGRYTDEFARSEFKQWCEQANEKHGRASGESVVLFKNDEIIAEQASTNGDDES